jgi:cyclopropane fatty-acyl-phospholipid synthase-like methyltransferase
MPASPWEDEAFAHLSLANIDERFLPGTPQEVGFLEAEFCLAERAKVTDLGCGAGRHAIEFAKRGYSVVGVDISATMLDEAETRARQAGVEVEFRQMDLADLGKHRTEGRAFDAAICLCESGFDVLGGEAEDLGFLSGVSRLLKQGGRFCLTTLSALRKYRNPGTVYDYVKSIVHWQAPADDARDPLREDQRIYSPSELSMMLRLSGFQEVSI